MEQTITFRMLCQNAREKLRGHWEISIGSCLICVLILTAVSVIVEFGNSIVNLLISPLGFGLTLFFIRLDRRETVKIEVLFEPFRNYGQILRANLRPTLFVFLWLLV